jgi:hypothetical protein
MPSSSPTLAPDTDKKLLEEIRDNTRTISVKLFGSSDAEDETATGRLPKVEHSAKRAHERIDKLQTRIVWASGFAAAVVLMIEKVFGK